MTDPLVLLPGFMSDQRLFAPQIAALAHETALITVPLTLHDRIETMAQHVLAAAPDRFALVGHGLGGLVAMEVLQRGGGRLTRLALMSTHPLPEPPQIAAAREPQIIGARAGRLAAVMDEIHQAGGLAAGPRRIAVQQNLRDMALSLGAGVFERQSRALQRRRDQQALLRRSKVPLSVICGDQDRVCTVKRHVSMVDLAACGTLHVVENAGHWPTLEQPEQVTELLRNWLHAPLAQAS